MLWSFPVGTIAGTVVKLHVTFLLFVVWIAGAQFRVGGAEAALAGTAFVVLVFACVLAHEFGHILAARRYGIRTPEVILSPIGGIASLERIPEDPRQELVVALAGPAVNVVIAVVLLLGLGAAVDLAGLARIDDPGVALLARVAGANVILVLFNLIPAFPMDGGRVLRAVIAMRRPHVQATRIAARIGQGAAFVFAAVGLLVHNPILLVIALFVFLAASAELQQTQIADATRGLPVGQAMVSVVETLPTGACLDDAVDCLLRTAQKEFPVVDGAGLPRGLITRDVLVPALRDGGARTPVLEVMLRDIPSVPAAASLQDAMTLLARSGKPALFVTEPDGRLAGLLTPENIGEMMLIRAARPDWRFDKRN